MTEAIAEPVAVPLDTRTRARRALSEAPEVERNPRVCGGATVDGFRVLEEEVIEKEVGAATDIL